MSGVGKRTYLREVNPYLICPLCRGYLIDATTVVECLHSFCRSCILKHLNTEAHCPSCKHVLNKAKPNIKADKALQDIVYKLVPGLYHKEMRKRREFYKRHPEHADFATPEQRGEDVSGRLIFAPEDAVSLSLEYLPPGADPLTILLSTNDDTSTGPNNQNNASSNRRYLQCPALVTIAHLKKFLALKYSVDMTRYAIEICHRRAPLPEHWTLMDVAYIYAWKRNAPMRFFYRVALEEQRLEAPPHDRPSTPGLGASLPPIDATVTTKDSTEGEEARNDTETKAPVERSNDRKERPKFDSPSKLSREKTPVVEERKPSEEVKKVEAKAEEPASSVATLTTVTSTTVSVPISNTTTSTAPNTVASTASNNETKQQMKTPIKILKNPDGRYEVLRSPSLVWNAKEQNALNTETKSSSPEFSVVSIGSGQNSNGVKITLKQCSPTNNTTVAKPKVISNVLLKTVNPEEDSPNALVMQQLQRDREKQEKQRRRVTFVERSASEKSASNALKTTPKKPGEQQDKKQFLHGFQLTARESSSNAQADSSIKTTEANVSNKLSDAQSKSNNAVKKEQESVATEATGNAEGPNKSNAENASANVTGSVSNAGKRVAATGGVNGNARVTANKQCSEVDARAFSYAKSSVATVNINAKSNPAKVDVYTFANEPPVVPAGAVKRKCPPGLPIFDMKRKKQQQVQAQAPKKQTPVSTPSLIPTSTHSSSAMISAQSNAKSPRKLATEHVIPAKRPANLIGEAGPSRVPAIQSSKPPTSPMLSNDTRNILDGCGLNIPASLSITLTAPKSPANNGIFVKPNESKDNRKNTLGKVSPSITLNDRSVDPRVLKALKAGQIRMPAPPKPRQSKQPEREVIQQRPPPPSKRKREQESREILDLSGGKKVDMHPLRIPQPVTKLKAKTPVRDNVPNIVDQGQVVTLMGGHRYYRAPPGSLTPAAHRVSDCPISTSSRAPVYAPGLSSPMSNSRPNANLSSVFPSLQSLYALSQAPNLQQFQMDARLRLPRPTEVNSSGIGTTDNRNMSNNLSGKSHLAAQCAPVKPARSSVASLAVPIAKQQQPNERSSSACSCRPPTNETSKTPAFRGNETLDSTDGGQQLSVQTKYSSTGDSNNRYSPRASSNRSVNSEDKASTEGVRDANSETNESVKESNNSRQTPHREAASPRVSSTASPSPPPGDTNANANNDNDVPASSPTKSNAGPEVSSSKSPASPDSSSVTVESSTVKTSSAVEQGFSSPSEGLKSSDNEKLLGTLIAKPDRADPAQNCNSMYCETSDRFDSGSAGMYSTVGRMSAEIEHIMLHCAT